MEYVTFSVSMNGKLEYFFPSFKVFSRATLNPFTYFLWSRRFFLVCFVGPPRILVLASTRYQKMHLSRICFADDIKIFYGGSFYSKTCVIDAVLLFGSLFELRMNTLRGWYCFVLWRRRMCRRSRISLVSPEVHSRFGTLVCHFLFVGILMWIGCPGWLSCDSD